MNLTEKLLSQHMVFGTLAPGGEIGLRVEQTLTQDALGMLTYMAFEQMGLPQVRTELSVSYLDHNMAYLDYRNPDDHAYLRGIAKRYGIYLSEAGNGICHVVHLSRFAIPGKLVVGTDSHTPCAGAAGMLGIGAGGLEVAAVMAGQPLRLRCPRVIRVELTGRLGPGVNAKDAALVLVGQLKVKGGLGAVLEYTGAGLQDLTVPQRMTLANMGAEVGATSSLFPSDEQTRTFFRAQGREEDWLPLSADADARYDETIFCDLSQIVPMVALPHQPDRVVPVTQAGSIKVDQVFIGSCTNSSYTDLTRAAAILKGHTVAEGVSLVVTPGTRQSYALLLQNGAIESFVQAGARILECGCGPCVGLGQAVRTGGVSVRTSNRNFKGRCGTEDSSVYLVSPETAAATAVLGRLATVEDPKLHQVLASISEPERYGGDDRMLRPPTAGEEQVEILRGPNIQPIPMKEPLQDRLEAKVVIRLGDNVSTDEIAPAGARNVSMRSNIPAVSRSTFSRLDPSFADRALQYGQSMIIAGENYGQGSSREHAALMPMFLGVQAVLAKSFARIHRTNLINFGILPLVFQDPADWKGLEQGDSLELVDIWKGLDQGRLLVRNQTHGAQFTVELDISPYERELLLSGGLLRYIKNPPTGKKKELGL
ncbi:MAG: aconitate hydratase [Angelakisella sp.]|jgi:aconitate hydratase|nr:aconitate hydratase [Angelakisella sp.]